MFGTTYWGLRASRGTAYLIPCLHDKPHARLPLFRDMFRRADRLILHTVEEQQLARSLYGLADDQCVVLGEGVDTDWTACAKSFRQTYGLEAPFVLYAGRRGPAKNTPTLIDYFRRYRDSRGADLDLVLIGSGNLDPQIAADSYIHDLGFVSVVDKHNAYAAAMVFCQPSLHESFSLVVMEAWLAGTPVLVHGGCAVTKGHCNRSNGGLYFTGYAEFEACLDLLMSNASFREALGANGRDYVTHNFTWDTIVRRYCELLGATGAS